MNKFIITGRLGSDPELKETKSGESAVFVSVAVQSVKDTVHWIRVAFYDKNAELVSQYCSKGDSVLVEGSIATTKYMSSGVEVNGYNFTAYRVEFLNTKRTEDLTPGKIVPKKGSASGKSVRAGSAIKESPDDDDGSPF